MDAGRIDVNVSGARTANAIASQAESASPPVAGPVGAVPGMFAVVSAATSAVNAAAVAGRAGLAAHLAALDEGAREAVMAYEVADEENRRSLMVAQE